MNHTIHMAGNYVRSDVCHEAYFMPICYKNNLGLDHRVGPLWALHLMSESSHTSFLGCV